MTLRIAQVKVYPVKGDLQANHRRLMAILAALAHEGPDVVVTPECFLDGYVATEDWVDGQSIRRYAVDPLRSELVGEVRDWAAAHRAWVALGCTRLASGGAANSALLIDRSGSQVGVYDKVHCQTHDAKFVPGDSLPVFDSDFGPFGVMICADRRWPETVRTLALGGARIILNPTYGMHDERNLRMMQTRSYESEVVIAFTHPGQSLITGPRGEIVTDETSEARTYAVSDVDLDVVDQVRAGRSAHLRDRRPDVYRL
ncbi:MAG: carbon-nitrogen hydrolase family protein [Anaerolineae bacterium]|nr:carbon-nitrogen hydrolase family protein [Anaerolineae bacterium]